MLETDPAKRQSAEECMKNEWFNDVPKQHQSSKPPRSRKKISDTFSARADLFKGFDYNREHEELKEGDETPEKKWN